jgi:membrane protein DedA with SNARE-associated domain
MLEFIDKIVIPFLTSLYGAVGYLGVSSRWTIESAMIPLPSELILPFAGFLVSDPDADRADHGSRGTSGSSVIAPRSGNTSGSLIAYAIGAWGGRPFLERYGKYILIRPHEIELAERFFDRSGAPTAFFSRLLPIVRTFISFPAGVARMRLGSSSSTRRPARSCGRSCSSTRARVLGAAGRTSATRSSRSTWRSRRAWSSVRRVHLVAPRDAGRRGRRRPSDHPGAGLPDVTTWAAVGGGPRPRRRVGHGNDRHSAGRTRSSAPRSRTSAGKDGIRDQQARPGTGDTAAPA